MRRRGRHLNQRISHEILEKARFPCLILYEICYNTDVMNRKRIYETDAVKAFYAAMSAASKRKYDHALAVLRESGRLRYPEAEKFAEQDNLFAIRIISQGNERFFYCYDDGETVAVVHAFAKRTAKTPPLEIRHALMVRKTLLGE